MQAKETVQTRWNRLRRQRGTGEKVSVDATALMRFADTAIHFLLAAVLAGASVFGDYAPFGVALVGAAGSGVCGAAALVGACFGYMVLLGFADGLRYAAAAILTFAVGFAFYDWKLLRRPWAMPLVAGFINSCTGFIYLSEGGWRTVDVIYFLTELVLIVASGWCYRQLLLPMRAGRGVELLSPARRASLTVLLCTVLMSLSGLYLVKDISLGRALAVAAVLVAAGVTVIMGAYQTVLGGQGRLLITDLYQVIYEGPSAGAGIGGLVRGAIFSAAVGWMLAALGQFCSALYWRLNKFWTILISVTVPLVLIFGSVPLISWLGTTSAGRAAVEALAAFGQFLAASPWNAAAVLLAMGAAFFALSWLLLRRAMIRPAK